MKKRSTSLMVLVFSIISIFSFSLFISGCGSTPTNTDKAEVNQDANYTQVRLDDMLTKLQKNPIDADKEYKGKDLEISGGTLAAVDADGKFVTIKGEGEDFTLKSIEVNINPRQKDELAKMQIGQPVVVFGKVTDVNNTKGYVLTAAKIEKRS